MSRRSSFLAALVAAILLAGCGGPGSAPAPAPTTSPGIDPALWMGRFCDAALSFATPVRAAPDFAAVTDLNGLQRTYSTYLGTVATGVRSARAALDGLEPSPVPGGDDAVGRVRHAMTLLGQDFTGAKATVDSADPAKPDAFVASVKQVESTLGAVTVPDVLGEVAAVPALAKAAALAEPCTRLAALRQ